MLIGGYVRFYLELLDKLMKTLLNISSLDECLERRDSIDSGFCFKIYDGWFEFLCIYVISLLVLQKSRKIERLMVTSR